MYDVLMCHNQFHSIEKLAGLPGGIDIRVYDRIYSSFTYKVLYRPSSLICE